MSTLIVDGLAAATTLTLRLTSVLFVRHHPLGPRYLPRIYWSFGLYVATFLVQLILSKNGRRMRRPSGSVLLLGWLDLSRPRATLATVLINFLCLAAVLDFSYRGHILRPSRDLSFSRVGFVDQTSARIVVRAPASDNNAFVELSVFSPNQTERVFADVIHITVETDYVGTFVLHDLDPGTAYTYTTNASHTGSFRTQMPHPKTWSLASTSCIKPFYPYNPLNHALRIPGLEHLDSHLAQHPVDYMLFLGDFIYIDLPLPLGWTQDHYTTSYRQVYASPSWTDQLRAIPWIHLYDDHEIINDWAANETGLYQTAIQPFWDYQGHANPPSSFGDGKTHFVFKHGDVAFFVLDTRRYRSAEEMADGPGKTMLGEEQLQDLKTWLKTEKAWKVVVSSVPFTRNWRGPDASDSWAGYLWERDQILDMMKATDGVVILSGDRHEHATTLFPPNAKGGRGVIEFSTSPLNQFYEPFMRTHKEVEDTDVSVYSHPRGNSKFGVVTFDTSVEGRWDVHYDLIVDGKKVWKYDWTYSRLDL